MRRSGQTASSRGDGEVKFNYEDFGVKVPAVLFHTLLAGDEVTVHFHIVAGQRRRASH